MTVGNIAVFFAGFKRLVQSLRIDHASFLAKARSLKQPLFRKQTVHSRFNTKRMSWETFEKKRFPICLNVISSNYAIYTYSKCCLPFLRLPPLFPFPVVA